MNAVGIDVSKGKSMVAIMRPFGEIVVSPFEIKHTSSDINSLIELIHSVDGESRIVMEHTGRYYEALAHELSAANLFVSAINPKLIKDFDNDSLRKVKSDKADSVKIARYALDKWQNLKQYSVMDELRIQLKTMNRQFGFMRPFGEIVVSPFEIKHTSSDINSLIELIHSVDGESRIVMEHTGRYYEALAHELSAANLFVSAINPKLIKDFDNVHETQNSYEKQPYRHP